MEHAMQLTPVIAIHIAVALTAVVIGPLAIWARRGHGAGSQPPTQAQRPKLHRAFGYAWVTCMVITAISALWIRDYRLPNIAGYTPIHLLIPFVLGMFFIAFRALAKGDIRRHQRTMVGTYIGGCLVTGALTLVPGRLMHQWLLAAL
jgi:uncharacterized membrane protein